MKTKPRAGHWATALVMLAVATSCASSPPAAAGGSNTSTASPTSTPSTSPYPGASAVAAHSTEGVPGAGIVGATTAPDASTVEARTTRATITGHFLRIGGPAPGGQVTAIAGAVAAYQNSTGTGTPAASTHSDSAGRFTFHLLPGTYYLVGVDTQVVGPGGHPTLVSSRAPVVAKQGAVTTADLRLYVP